MRIRAVDLEDDKDLLDELDRECFPDDAVCDKDGYWWIAYDGQRPIAFAGMNPSVQWTHCGYLCRAGVVPAYRGRGLQRRLIQVRERKARKLGWEWVVTYTVPDNYASANNLIRCGYTLYAPAYPWGSKTSLYWRKKLT